MLKLVVNNKTIEMDDSNKVYDYLAKHNPIPEGLKRIITAKAMADHLEKLWNKNVTAYEGNDGVNVYKIRVNK